MFVGNKTDKCNFLLLSVIHVKFMSKKSHESEKDKKKIDSIVMSRLDYINKLFRFLKNGLFLFKLSVE